MPEQDPRKVTVEDLLRLKRTERPGEAFWSEFDKEMRQKQLAALVKEKAWWEVLPAKIVRFVFHPIPIGASAALVMGVVGIRTFVGSAVVVQTEDASNIAVRSSEHADTTPATFSDSSSRIAAQEQISDAIPQPGNPDDSTNLVAMIPWATSSQSMDSIQVSGGDPTGIAVLAYPRKAQPSHLASTERAIVLPAMMIDDSDPAQMTQPESQSARERRLTALKAGAGYTPEAAPSEQTRYRLSRYLSDDGFERSMNRLAAQGDRLSVRF